MEIPMEKLYELPLYTVLAAGLLLMCLLFVLMFRFAEAENLALVLLTTALISLVSIAIVKTIVYKKRYGDL